MTHAQFYSRLTYLRHGREPCPSKSQTFPMMNLISFAT